MKIQRSNLSKAIVPKLMKGYYKVRSNVLFYRIWIKADPIFSNPSKLFKLVPEKKQFKALDKQWEKHGKPLHFNYIHKAQLEGVQEKAFYQDLKGQKWLFKLPLKNFKTHRTTTDEVAYKISRLINPHSIETRSIKLNGKIGSIQPWIETLKPKQNFMHYSLTKLTKEEIEQIQREHVIDWLITNNDAKASHFLRGQDGKIYSVDKHHILFLFTNDQWGHTDMYSPKYIRHLKNNFYAHFFKMVKKGKIKIDPLVSLLYIKKVENIDNRLFIRYMKPAVQALYPDNLKAQQQTYHILLHRKNNMRLYFERLYADILKKPDFKFSQ